MIDPATRAAWGAVQQQQSLAHTSSWPPPPQFVPAPVTAWQAYLATVPPPGPPQSPQQRAAALALLERGTVGWDRSWQHPGPPAFQAPTPMLPSTPAAWSRRATLPFIENRGGLPPAGSNPGGSAVAGEKVEGDAIVEVYGESGGQEVGARERLDGGDDLLNTTYRVRQLIQRLEGSIRLTQAQLSSGILVPNAPALRSSLAKQQAQLATARAELTRVSAPHRQGILHTL